MRQKRWGRRREADPHCTSNKEKDSLNSNHTNWFKTRGRNSASVNRKRRKYSLRESIQMINWR